MTSLYKMVREYWDSWQEMEDIDELDEQSISDTLESLQLPIQDKIINTSCYIKNIESDIHEIERIENELFDRKKKLKKRVDNLKKYILQNMLLIGIEKIRYSLFDISIRLNPESVFVSDESLIDNKFIKIKEVKSIDKIAIKNTIKSGMSVNGAELIKTKSLIIK